jgi:hypothetical protein
MLTLSIDRRRGFYTQSGGGTLMLIDYFSMCFICYPTLTKFDGWGTFVKNTFFFFGLNSSTATTVISGLKFRVSAVRFVLLVHHLP